VHIASKSILIYSESSTEGHKQYKRWLSMPINAQNVPGGIPSPEAEASAKNILRHVPPSIEQFESRYAEWLATAAEAVWGYLDGPLPGLPEIP
jgi:hypothetical protein